MSTGGGGAIKKFKTALNPESRTVSTFSLSGGSDHLVYTVPAGKVAFVKYLGNAAFVNATVGFVNSLVQGPVTGLVTLSSDNPADFGQAYGAVVSTQTSGSTTGARFSNEFGFNGDPTSGLFGMEFYAARRGAIDSWFLGFPGESFSINPAASTNCRIVVVVYDAQSI